MNFIRIHPENLMMINSLKQAENILNATLFSPVLHSSYELEAIAIIDVVAILHSTVKRTLKSMTNSFDAKYFNHTFNCCGNSIYRIM